MEMLTTELGKGKKIQKEIKDILAFNEMNPQHTQTNGTLGKYKLRGKFIALSAYIKSLGNLVLW